MTIQPIGDGSLLGNAAQASYDAARMNAEGKSFKAALDEMQRKADTAQSHTDQAAPTGHVPKNSMTADDLQQKKLREACEGFEAMFLSMMYKQMRATVPEGGLFGKKSNALKIFEDMRDTELMNEAAKSGGIGLADMMMKQLSPTIRKR
ncbi:rod-binding protein [Selenomonas flueggei]|uniref:rod-binding protein n=1 Tax=Selenomonas flueggei TaxID=135080 RepID=UPI002672B769|nr:rod-binding protein [Selenomonas flueggei]